MMNNQMPRFLLTGKIVSETGKIIGYTMVEDRPDGGKVLILLPVAVKNVEMIVNAEVRGNYLILKDGNTSKLPTMTKGKISKIMEESSKRIDKLMQRPGRNMDEIYKEMHSYRVFRDCAHCKCCSPRPDMKR